MSRRRSLRNQLLVLGLGAALVPLLLLLVVFSTSSSEVDITEGGTERAITETESSFGLPPEVAVAALVLAMLAAAAVWFWASRAVRPMAAITRVANEIQAGSLDRRIGLDGAPAEVQSLADSFDAMLHRLDRSTSTQRRLIEDASHELRTPLTALAVNNDVILSNPSPTLDDYRASAERSRALIDRLQLTIDELLTDARSRNQEAQQVDNDLMEIVARVVDQHRAVNPTIPVVVRGPRELLLGIDGPSVQRAVVNLLDNAARYTPEGAPIEIDVAVGERTELSITDHGPGIPPDRLHSIFDRYFQGDEPSDGSGNAGIGLALVEQVADAHGGITVTSPLPGQPGGTRFTMAFPAPVERAAPVEPVDADES